MQFKAFKPEAMNKIAKSMGYSGDMGQFQNFIEQDPARQRQMNMYTNAAKMMARGGVVKMQTGGTPMPRGTVTNPQGTQAATPTVTTPTQPVTNAQGQITTPGVAQYSVEQMYTPGVPVGGTTIAAETQTNAAQNIAKFFPLSLCPSKIAPPATIVQGKPGNLAQGFALKKSQLVNATIVSTPPINISRIN